RGIGQVADLVASAAMFHRQGGVGFAQVVAVAIGAAHRARRAAHAIPALAAQAVCVLPAVVTRAAALTLGTTAVDVRLVAVLLGVSATGLDAHIVGADAAGAIIVLEAAPAGRTPGAVGTAAVHARFARTLLT